MDFSGERRAEAITAVFRRADDIRPCGVVWVCCSAFLNLLQLIKTPFVVCGATSPKGGGHTEGKIAAFTVSDS